ncbi:class F sortase [Marisediminicola antarctica]|uniref:Class F sortase n=1 Tax=Marisediminicola antarctica TaxID=674079 RepID=A0A7L5AH87_9MICO|nr:class F sortase [Marisediminicola antarctica]QHO68744.1 hypothetical protein BHD05_02910 [Marisediminicola antarctica]
MTAQPSKSRRGSLWATAAVLLLLGGGTAIALALTTNDSPPQPPASAASPPPPGTTATPPPPTPPVAATQTTGPIMPASSPTQVSIPAIGVDSTLMQLGLNTDGTAEVPPLDPAAPAGWYRGSPTPGELGPSIILGHVTSNAGHAVFYRLGDMRPGDEITITRADATTATFTVDAVEQYPKADFPTQRVYGNTDHAALRLITCGGIFDNTAGSHLDNIVVYATLTDDSA